MEKITTDISGAAEILKISSTTAYALAAAGTLPGARIGQQWVFLIEDLTAWLRTL